MDLLFRTYLLSPALKPAVRPIVCLTARKMLRKTFPGMWHKMPREMSRQTWPAVLVGALVARFPPGPCAAKPWVRAT